MRARSVGVHPQQCFVGRACRSASARAARRSSARGEPQLVLDALEAHLQLGELLLERHRHLVGVGRPTTPSEPLHSLSCRRRRGRGCAEDDARALAQDHALPRQSPKKVPGCDTSAWRRPLATLSSSTSTQPLQSTGPAAAPIFASPPSPDRSAGRPPRSSARAASAAARRPPPPHCRRRRPPPPPLARVAQ